MLYVEVLQRSGLSTIGDILRHRHLSLAMLHAWILECQHMMLCIWWWIPTKAESQWPAGEDRRAAVATSGSTVFRRMPTPYCYLRCGDLRSPGVMEWHNGPLRLHDDDDSWASLLKYIGFFCHVSTWKKECLYQYTASTIITEFLNSWEQ